MVFWKELPLSILLKSKLNNSIFNDLQFNRKKFSVQIEIKCKILEINDKVSIKKIREFIKNNFGNPPFTPILDIPENRLIEEKDLLLYIEDINNSHIIGCIRHHFIGRFISSNNEEIYCVDCFCIHPNWRKKGLGDYLLSELHRIANKNSKPYTIFLKEGVKLSIFNQPYYSGIYVYKKIDNYATKYLSSLSIKEAYGLINIFVKFNPDLFVIKNEENHNQIWKLYQKDSHKILICIQDTYQRFEKNNKMNKLCWITAWIESQNIPDIYREEASKEVAGSVFGVFDYIWGNKEWIGNSKDWSIDGPFHWFLYQWSTNINIKKSYCILN